MKSLKQLIRFLALPIGMSFVSCNEKSNPTHINSAATEQTTDQGEGANINVWDKIATTEIDNNIRSIYQANNGDYWFGTNGAGVYRYDGKSMNQFTVKDGLANDQIQNIQEDKSGNIWFGTGLFGVSRFDGQTFTTFTTKENLIVSTGAYNEWKIEPNDLWFCAGGGVYRYHNNALDYLPLDKNEFNSERSPTSPYDLSPFAVYSILKDKKGNLWFGTQAQGVCRFDGKTFTWFTENGLAGPAVLGLFEDTNGIIWFGNNGAGLYRYDGKIVMNFTKEKGLGNEEFRTSGKSGQGTLARIYSINEDNTGNLWIGTVDAGVWQYDGNNLTNYTTKDGLTSNAINTIYKDKNGELWFGTDDKGICKINGQTFSKYVTE